MHPNFTEIATKMLWFRNSNFSSKEDPKNLMITGYYHMNSLLTPRNMYKYGINIRSETDFISHTYTDAPVLICL